MTRYILLAVSVFSTPHLSSCTDAELAAWSDSIEQISEEFASPNTNSSSYGSYTQPVYYPTYIEPVEPYYVPQPPAPTYSAQRSTRDGGSPIKLTGCTDRVVTNGVDRVDWHSCSEGGISSESEAIERLNLLTKLRKERYAEGERTRLDSEREAKLRAAARQTPARPNCKPSGPCDIAQ